MPAQLISPPGIEPVTLADAKAHLRVDTTDDDNLIGALVTAARVQVEVATRRVLITQRWRLTYDRWPQDGLIELRTTPIQSVDAVMTYDATGSATPLNPAAYQVDLASVPARLALTVPLETVRPGRPLAGIEIDVTAGYGPSGLQVPQPLLLAMMMLVARWYESRDGTAAGTIPASIEQGFEALIAPYRVLRIA